MCSSLTTDDLPIPEYPDTSTSAGVPLTAGVVKGRNSWTVWSAGNDRFWDGIGVTAFGALDFLKTISSHASLKANRDNRWEYLGLVNEPCFVKPTGPDPKRHGLWLDQRSPDCPPDPFANATKYPGVTIGARGRTLPVGSYYGEPTGIVGLRLFPNPDFDEAAKRRWDSERYYRDPDWSVRDVVGHVGTWLAEAQVQLQRMSAGTYEGHDIDIYALNATFLKALADQPWEVAWLQATAGRSRMIEEWYRLREPNDEAAWWIRKAGGDHYDEHVPRLREWVAELVGRRRAGSSG